jgi:hypothetical protein
METEDNIIEFTGEWQGGDDEMGEAEYESAMQELLAEVDQERLGRVVAGVLEFLTVRAIIDGPFYLLTDDEQAITVMAANEDAEALLKALPSNFKSWDDYNDEAEEQIKFLTDTDPGDEQDEPTA